MPVAVIPARITEAREARALSMEELSAEIGVTRQAISKFEKGITPPSDSTLERIAAVLNFPIAFFYKPELAATSEGGALFFRSNLGVSQKVKKACRYQLKWADEVKQQLETYISFIPQELPVSDRDYRDLSLDEVEEIAMDVRSQWGMDDDPIGDLIGLLENHGIIVAEFTGSQQCEFRGIDALSCWENGTPYILYQPAEKSAVRIRFSILHELGHLLLHSDVPQKEASQRAVIDQADSQADRFASAFLLPADPFSRDLHGSSMLALERAKRKWGASIAAMIHRGADLHLLTESQLQYLNRQMTKQRYWRAEPYNDVMTIQPPEVLHDAVTLLIEHGVLSKQHLLRDSAIPQETMIFLCHLPEDYFDETLVRRKPELYLV